jgi:hypothetical protein
VSFYPASFGARARAGLVCLVLILLAPLAQAAGAGKVLFARGNVFAVQTDGVSRRLSVGEAVNVGEHLVTGPQGMLQLRLSDGALISLRGNSDYQIRRQQTQGLLEQAGTLFSGWMRAVSGAIGEARPESVSYNTPTATIGIRGTSFQMIHVPPSGLAGYEDAEPGTYVYLEQGGVQASSEAGKRFLDPGDVVWIAEASRRPEPAPRQRRLFHPQSLSAAESESSPVTVEDTPEALDGRDEGRIHEPLFVESDASPVAYTRVVGVSAWGDPVEGLSSGNVAYVDSGAARTMVEQREFGPGLESRILAGQNDAALSDQGFHQLADGSEINWGVWGGGSYTVDGTDASGAALTQQTPAADWHYMMGSNGIFDENELLAKGPTGSVTFNYVGGTTLTSPATPDTYAIDSGSIDVVFGSTNVDLQVTSLVLSGPSALNFNSALTPVADFFNNGVPLTDPGDPNASGVISGYFVGTNAEGLIGGLEITDGALNDYAGTAAFER